MGALLLKFLRPAAPYLIGAAVVLGVCVYVMVLRREVAAETEKNVALAQDNQANLAAIAAYKAQAVKWSAAMTGLDARAVARSTSVTRIVDGIGAAPAADDAPVAPVLAQALDGLRALQGGAP